LKGFLTGEKRSRKANLTKAKSITSSSKKAAISTSSPAGLTSAASESKLAATSKDESDATKSANAASFDDDETVYNVVMDETIKTEEASSPKALESVKESVEERTKTAEPEPGPKKTAETNKKEGASTTNPLDGAVAAAMPVLEPTLSAEESLQVILLLMEFKNRRFELLQLEFDPSKALISDILAQIPSAATEDELRIQEYVGICDVSGCEMPTDLQLKNFVTGENEVTLAIPAGISAADCAKLAAPILNNAKVRAMLGQTAVAVESPPAVMDTPSVRPVEKVCASEPAKKPTKVLFEQQEPVVEQKPAPRREGKTSPETKIADILGGVVDAAQEDVDNTSGAHTLKVLLAMVLIVAFVPLMLAQIRFTSPLGPGDQLKAGQFRRKCGVTSLTLTGFNGCNELSAEFDEGGVLTVYNLGSLLSKEKTVLYRLMAENTKAMSDDGLVIGADGSLTIGGKRVVVEVPSDSNPILSPWPFAKEVTLQKKKRKGGHSVWQII